MSFENLNPREVYLLVPVYCYYAEGTFTGQYRATRPHLHVRSNRANADLLQTLSNEIYWILLFDRAYRCTRPTVRAER